jgi:hypothetical protein
MPKRKIHDKGNNASSKIDAGLKRVEREVFRILTEDIGEPFVHLQSLFPPTPPQPSLKQTFNVSAKERSLLDIIGDSDGSSLTEIFMITSSTLDSHAGRSLADFRGLTVHPSLIKLGSHDSKAQTVSRHKALQEAADNRIAAMLSDDRLKKVAPEIKAILAPLDPVNGSNLAGLWRAVQLLKAGLPFARLARTSLLNQVNQVYVPSIRPMLRQQLIVETNSVIRTIDSALEKLDEAERLISPFKDRTWLKPHGWTKSLPIVTQAGVSLIQLFLKRRGISEVTAARCAAMVLCAYVPDMNGTDTTKFGASLRVKFQKTKATSSKLAFSVT